MTEDVVGKIDVYDMEGSFVKRLDLPEVANISWMSYHKLSNKVFVSFIGATFPMKIYQLDGKTLT